MGRRAWRVSAVSSIITVCKYSPVFKTEHSRLNWSLLRPIDASNNDLRAAAGRKLAGPSLNFASSLGRGGRSSG